MQLVDTHCHIYAKDFDPDRDQMIARARAAGIVSMLMPAISSETHESMLLLEAQNPGKCLSMMGLHPCSVKADYEDELDVVEAYFEDRDFIAVGEIGLDFYWDLTFKEQQQAAFRKQIRLALEHNIPIVIHSRSATDECIQIVRELQNGSLNGVFHCFSGTVEQARQIIELGFYLGIGGVVTFKNGGLDKVISELDLQRIILETDAPYLAPMPFRGKRNECSYISYVAEKIASIKQISPEQVGEMTTSNAKALFGL